MKDHFHPYTINLAILRTCKQVHAEGSPALYSKNRFRLYEGPHAINDWLTQIGPINVGFLKDLHINFDYIPDYPEDDKPICVHVAMTLAREAGNLRQLTIIFGGYEGCDRKLARTLAKIKVLERLELRGLYGMHWPKFLSQHMGVPVTEPEKERSLLEFQQRYTRHLFP